MSRMRLFLVWLLLAAVPLQGLAAASMLYCGIQAHHGQALQMATAGNTEVAAHDHAAHGHAVIASPQADAAGQLPDAAHSCGVCGSCCSSVAIAGLPSGQVLSAPPRAELTELRVHVRAIVSPVPDKPPRV